MLRETHPLASPQFVETRSPKPPYGLTTEGYWFTPRQNFGKKLKLLVVNRNFKDPRKGFETVKDALSRVDQKEFEVTLVGSNSDWAAKDLKGGIGVRNLDCLHDRGALVRPYGESEIFLFASRPRIFLVRFWRPWPLVVALL